MLFRSWLSPQGEFVQSARGMFDKTAEFVLHKTSERLKSERWILLDKLGNEPYYTPRNLVTKKQYDWLKKHGYETVDMEDLE